MDPEEVGDEEQCFELLRRKSQLEKVADGTVSLL